MIWTYKPHLQIYESISKTDVLLKIKTKTGTKFGQTRLIGLALFVCGFHIILQLIFYLCNLEI